jgi:hypothetical protein
MRPRPSRRAFLKAAAGAAGLCCLAGLPAERGLRLVSARPLPYPHHFLSDPDAPLEAWLAADALLLPACAAARLIAAGEALELRGEVPTRPGRPHDPDGAFTLPQGVAFAALVAFSLPGAPSLAELWQAGAVWPDSARLALGAALMRRGYCPNDTHPGHLAECERDLLSLRPRLALDPVSAVRQGGGLALAWVEGPALPGGLQAALPLEGALFSEYDWVIPRRSARAGRALAFLRSQRAQASAAPRAWLSARAVPLAPLTPEARARLRALWARVR